MDHCFWTSSDLHWLYFHSPQSFNEIRYLSLLLSSFSASLLLFFLLFCFFLLLFFFSSLLSCNLIKQGLQCTDATLKTCDFTPCSTGKNCAYSIQSLFNQYKVDILSSSFTLSPFSLPFSPFPLPLSFNDHMLLLLLKDGKICTGQDTCTHTTECTQ